MLPRAVCLQMLHPSIATGIYQHSIHRERIWLHERRTVPASIEIAELARDMRPFIRFGHEHVRGEDHRGCKYHALNPDIFHFQHATWVETLVTLANLLDGPLEAKQHEQLYQECCDWYRRYGISTRPMPAHWPAFVEYFDEQCRTQLSVGPHFEPFRSEIFAPSDWWPRLAPKRAIRGMQHERACELTGIRVSAGDRRALRRFVTLAGALPSRR